MDKNSLHICHMFIDQKSYKSKNNRKIVSQQGTEPRIKVVNQHSTIPKIN